MSSVVEATAHDPTGVMAAVDLGSNSFHMIVARVQQGEVVIVDRLREMVRLASGLSELGYLDGASQDRALACLRRFGQRIRDMHADQVRVVGTNTLRTANNAELFLSAAEEALGQPVEVISGIEEARLIYLGVSHTIESSPGTNLVVDIGGGSTEFIIGQGFEPSRLESLIMGCVGLSNRYFGGGQLSRNGFDRARLAVSLELRPVAASFKRQGWDRAIGSSGTIKSAAALCAALGFAESGVTSAGIDAIIAEMISAGRADKLKLPGLDPERAPVFAGGMAILAEVLSTLEIDSMLVSEGALREGLLYDMIGRLKHEDTRERSIRAMQARFHVDEEQAQRVDVTSAGLLDAVAGDWLLADDRYRQLLHWAARLHEVGLDIAHAGYHEHGAYLVENSDMPGFASVEQRMIATLIGCHRRKLDRLDMTTIPDDMRGPLFKLIILLRLAVLLNRARSPVELPSMLLVGGANRLELKLPRLWLSDNPLTQADLEQEQAFLSARGFELALGLRSRGYDDSARELKSDA